MDKAKELTKYSVLMSVYNKELPDRLNLSISSIENQTLKPDQFVIVLDGPISDELQAVINDHVKNNPTLFEIVSLELNCGLAKALNAGLAVCKNELVARMDSDDFSLPERCEKQVMAFIEESDYALIGTSTRNFVDNLDNIITYRKKRALSYEEIRKAIKKNCPFCPPAVMFRLSVVRECGCYDPELRRSQDYDLFAKIIWKGYKAKNLSDELLLFRADEGFETRTKSKESCKYRVQIQKRIWKRGQCSLADYLFIKVAMVVTRILPKDLYKFMYRIIKGKQ